MPENDSLNAHERMFDNEQVEDQTLPGKRAIPYINTDITNKNYNTEQIYAPFLTEKEIAYISDIR